MTPQNSLEISGDFRVHPAAELLVEIVQAKLTGALRLSHETKKTIVYFRDGAIVFGVSNAREHRLLTCLLKAKRIQESDLAKIPRVTNDMDLAAALQQKRILSKEEIEEVFVSQIGDIIVDFVSWPAGKWSFSPLARLREDIIFPIEIHKLLFDYARCVNGDVIMQRFKSVHESFVRQIEPVPDLLMQPQEACVMEVFQHTPLKFDELRQMLNMPEAGLAQSLYSLWLGGVLVRIGWNKAFTEAKVADIKKAVVSRVREAAPLANAEPERPAEPAPQPEAPAEPAAPAEPEISLEDWLKRAEGAETHYDLLGISNTAAISEIKQAYFAMAKLFHPDRFHRETGTNLRRIQVAFTGLAHAYETLKSSESRESYDYKIRKEMETRQKRKEAGEPEVETAVDRQAEQALDNFEQGLHLLNDDEPEAA
ncbi:MAG TPA: DnaJ domain-containing protein, partial [Pyrinomonadaceae bacterium]|nr:DnaJ domain-containing protein [Pyrinomonadaceae bacterium]